MLKASEKTGKRSPPIKINFVIKIALLPLTLTSYPMTNRCCFIKVIFRNDIQNRLFFLGSTLFTILL